jgi:carbamoyl-phosphate synthase large subunit
MNEDIVMAINTSDGEGSNDARKDGSEIRRTVLRMNVPYVTTVAGALASVEAIKQSKNGSSIEPKSIQDFLND